MYPTTTSILDLFFQKPSLFQNAQPEKNTQLSVFGLTFPHRLLSPSSQSIVSKQLLTVWLEGTVWRSLLPLSGCTQGTLKLLPLWADLDCELLPVCWSFFALRHSWLHLFHRQSLSWSVSSLNSYGHLG